MLEKTFRDLLSREEGIQAVYEVLILLGSRQGVPEDAHWIICPTGTCVSHVG